MTSAMWLSLVACAGLVALAGLSLARVGRGVLALPLSLLCICLSTWDFASFALVRSGESDWRLVGALAALMMLPSALHFILAFVGRRKRSAWAMYGAYAVMGLVGFALLASPSTPALAVWRTPSRLALLMGALALPVLAAGFWLLGAHLLRARQAEERARAGLVLLGLALTVALLLTDFAADLGLRTPRLGSLGTLLGLPVMATVALRFRLFGEDEGARAALSAGVLALLGVLAYLAVFWLFAGEAGPLVIGTTTITFAMLAAARRGVTAFVTQRERWERLATLGRFSAQMAHDLRNPIAAMKGAAQYLKEEHARGQPWDAHGDFLDLLLEQVERLDGVVGTYQRLARVEPLMRPLDLHRLVDSVLSLQAFANPGKVVLVRALAPTTHPLAGDEDLLTHALENLVRNAFEAMPSGGTLTVRTTVDAGGVTLAVEDTGEGMDARTRERAFDEFFTTKASGSGLGLAFVRRVVEAHGGSVTLTSNEGRGTILSLHLPTSSASPARQPHGDAA
ncbi:HAMP domain-containing histidine kinase [Myxococcaceae bacterium JPH2]|nr:HAMP domain-containing histidine kinase [Myxococcaceae bacterium JPH2]